MDSPFCHVATHGNIFTSSRITTWTSSHYTFFCVVCLSPQVRWLAKVKELVTQSCLTLFNSKDWSPPGSSVLGILQARYWSGLPCPSPGDLPNQGSNPGIPCRGHILYHLSYQGSQDDYNTCIWSTMCIIRRDSHAYENIFVYYSTTGFQVHCFSLKNTFTEKTESKAELSILSILAPVMIGFLWHGILLILI